jgi:hypothetical protein
MKKLFFLAALGALLATPALAQHVPDDDSNAGQRRRSTVPPGGIYYGRNAATNDFQTGASRWKTNAKAQQHARRRHHHSAGKK